VSSIPTWLYFGHGGTTSTEAQTARLPIYDGSKISAEFKDGMLMVMLPKTATAIPKQIEMTVK